MTASVSTVMIIDILKLIIDQIAGGTLKQTIHFIVIKNADCNMRRNCV